MFDSRQTSASLSTLQNFPSNPDPVCQQSNLFSIACQKNKIISPIFVKINALLQI